MAANCAQLRQSLAHLQTQLNVLTNKKEKEDAAPKQEKAKKSKSKKNKEKQAQKVEEKPEIKEENDEAAKPAEIVPSGSEDKAQIEVADEKVDDKTLENLIQAINSANINLCDLEVVNDENDLDSAIVDEVLEIEINESKSNEVNANGEINAEAKFNAVPETKLNEVVEAKVNEVPVEKLNEEEAKVSEVPVEKVNEVNSNTKVVTPVLNEANSNEEVSHIPEVKPISVENA